MIIALWRVWELVKKPGIGEDVLYNIDFKQGFIWKMLFKGVNLPFEKRQVCFRQGISSRRGPDRESTYRIFKARHIQ